MPNEIECLLNNGYCFRDTKKKDIAILMIHGFAASPKELEPLADFLKPDFDVFVPLLPGHKTNMADFSKKKYTDWLDFSEELYNKLQQEYSKVILLGFSMGGTICLNLASKKNPYKLITISSPIDFYDINFTKGILNELRNTKISLSTIVSEIQALSIKEKEEKEKDKAAKIDKIKTVFQNIYSKIRKDFIKVNNDMSDYIDTYEEISYAAVHEVFLLAKNTKPKLQKIKSDLLVIHSRGDTLIPVSNSFEIINGVSSDNIELCLVNNSKHHVIIDSDHDVAFKRIKDFITRTF